jgi:hypothetical protein
MGPLDFQEMKNLLYLKDMPGQAAAQAFFRTSAAIYRGSERMCGARVNRLTPGRGGLDNELYFYFRKF